MCVGRAAEAGSHYLCRRWFPGCAAYRQLSGRGRRRSGGAKKAGGSRGHRLPTQPLTQRHLPALGSGHTAATAPVRIIHENKHEPTHFIQCTSPSRITWWSHGREKEEWLKSLLVMYLKMAGSSLCVIGPSFSFSHPLSLSVAEVMDWRCSTSEMESEIGSGTQHLSSVCVCVYEI